MAFCLRAKSRMSDAPSWELISGTIGKLAALAPEGLPTNDHLALAQEMCVDEIMPDSHFGKLHAQHVGALIRHLVECRRAFDGDLDLFLVLTIIGERTFPAKNAPAAMSQDEFLHGHVGDTEPAAINQQSIADYSGIPRETVRRKIEILIEKGWIQRDEHKLLTATDKANEELFLLTESTVRYLREIQIAIEASKAD